MSLKGIAKETLQILSKGEFISKSGNVINFATEQKMAEEATKLYCPEEVENLLQNTPCDTKCRCSVEVTHETTQAAAYRLVKSEGCQDLLLLNYASARNPGGGFINGAKAQEEDLARCSGLYPCQLKQPKYYDYCEKLWGTRTPTVLDAFAGGGSIPFEAARYGLNVLASDLNPVAVVTMKAAMEYPLKFGPDLQQDIDKWVKWVGDEAQKRLAEFFPSLPGETVQNYLWAHTVVCPSCESVVPLSPNWWLSKTSNYAGKGQARKITSDWYAVKPIPNPENKRVDFELVKGRKGKGTTIQTDDGEYEPDDYNTISRGVGKCPNCANVIDNEYISSPSQESKLGHQIYAVAYKKGKGSLEFTTPTECDLKGVYLAELKFIEKLNQWEINNLISHEPTPMNPQYSMIRNYGIIEWTQCYNYRQNLTLINYVEIINEAKALIHAEYEWEKAEAISTYLALVFDRCVDVNCRLAHVNAMGPKIEGASGQHALNLIWNYPEVNGSTRLWQWCADKGASNYFQLCALFGTKSGSTGIPGIEKHDPKSIQINSASADNLTHIPEKSVDAIVIDPVIALNPPVSIYA